ncbi:MAG: CopG family transcriptional regulator [Deltaproteobacteria bacterium RIFOXYD12_FULL_56_24]|nr:MAG: CopG family transcriptional regulator [Deltaproteobacteria bacterium RIFOXYD12_FULL_56_24]
MPTASGTINKRETLNIRIKPEERNLIDLAARMRGKNRTDFILEAVRSAAEEALFEQTIIMASPETYAKFLARLDEQPRPNARLRDTMQTPAPWEKA